MSLFDDDQTLFSTDPGAAQGMSGIFGERPPDAQSLSYQPQKQPRSLMGTPGEENKGRVRRDLAVIVYRVQVFVFLVCRLCAPVPWLGAQVWHHGRNRQCDSTAENLVASKLVAAGPGAAAEPRFSFFFLLDSARI